MSSTLTARTGLFPNMIIWSCAACHALKRPDSAQQLIDVKLILSLHRHAVRMS